MPYTYRYTVNDKKFMNYFVAQNYAKDNNGFVDFKLDSKDISAFENADLDTVFGKDTQSIYKIKLQKLRQDSEKLRLHYSAGTDSHTILAMAQELGIDFDDVVLEACSMKGDPTLDGEINPGIEYAKKNNVKNFRVVKPEIKHFEKYLDPKWIEDVSGSQYFGFRGAKLDVVLRDAPRMIDLTGMDKPWIYVSAEGKYYWVLTDYPFSQQMRWDHVLFYLDSIVPEAALKQAYQAKSFLKQYYPEHIGMWQAEYKLSDVEHLKIFNQSIGRAPALSELSANPNKAGKGHPLYLGYKNYGQMTELREMGRGDLVDAFYHSLERVKTVYKDQKHCIEVDSSGNVTGVGRYAAVFELGDNFVKHTSDDIINLPLVDGIRGKFTSER